MTRAFNFSAGPAALPDAVLQRAQKELLDWNGQGVSVMEISHRSDWFLEMAQKTESLLRSLLTIPDSHDVLFMQGGATAQFSWVPMNLGTQHKKAAYLDSGFWSKKAIKIAKNYLDVEVIPLQWPNSPAETPLSSEVISSKNTALFDFSAVDFSALAADKYDYVHYTPNETIDGVELSAIPETPGLSLVADFSSSILSKPLDVNRFDLIYAGAQKNIGPSGICMVIIRRSWCSKSNPLATLPDLFNYKKVTEQRSMVNTPPTFAWYMCGLMFEWLHQQGGLAAMEEQNRLKAQRLYQCIDQSRLYENKIPAVLRSRMNVPFWLKTPSLEGQFLQEAHQRQLLGLKGHRAVGGMRASLYNAVGLNAVDALVDYMIEFENHHAESIHDG